MADPRGFLKLGREKEHERDVESRLQDWREVALGLPEANAVAQASRCMDCGIPFCQSGCPLGNLIPEWNDLVHRGESEEAGRRLLETNNFPEITGRICPAPCEASCVLNLDEAPVAIKAIERTIADGLRAAGLAPRAVVKRSGAKVAVVGSGPAGLTTAQELARLGHAVTVLERDDRLGGLLRYGIPDFKLEKAIIDERIAQLGAEGVRFETGVDVGTDVSASDLRHDFDRVVLAGGARRPRALGLAGADLAGVHYAMTFLTAQNRRAAGEHLEPDDALTAAGKRVVVIGGGDTGSDCVGTSVRQHAVNVLQLELMAKPTLARAPANPWPEWPLVLRSSTSHDEGCDRDWGVKTLALLGDGGRVRAVQAVRVEWTGKGVREIEGSRFEIPCELVLLAMGFVGPEDGLVRHFGLATDTRGNVVTDAAGQTGVPGLFATGDMSRGQSLVVWAIADGRRVAAGVDASLQKRGARNEPETRAAGDCPAR